MEPSSEYRESRRGDLHRGLTAVLLVCAAGLGFLLYREKSMVAALNDRIEQAKRHSSAERKELDATTHRYMREKQSRQDLEAALDFLKRAIVSAPADEDGRSASPKDVLDAAGARLDGGALADRPEKALEMRRTLGRAYVNLGYREEAAAQFRIVLEAVRKRGKPDDPTLLHDLFSLARALAKPDEDSSDFPESPSDSAGEEATALLKEAAELHGRLLAQRPWGRVGHLYGLAESAVQRDDLEDAVGFLRYAEEVLLRQFGPEHPHTMNCMVRLAAMLLRHGKTEEARDKAALAVEMIRDRVPTGHPHLSDALSVHGRILLETGDAVAAEAALRECLVIRRAALEERHWRTGEAMNLLGRSLSAQREYEEAQSLLLEGLDIMDDTKDAPPDRVRESRRAIAAMYEAWGKPERAEQFRRGPK